MPLLLIPVFALAGLLGYEQVKGLFSSTQGPSDAGGVPVSSSNISPFTAAVYAAGGLGLYWLYRKAKKA